MRVLLAAIDWPLYKRLLETALRDVIDDLTFTKCWLRVKPDLFKQRSC
jgi:hypothetical protein